MRIPKNCSARVLLRAFVLLAALFSAWIPARAAPPLRVSEADARLDAPPPQFQWLGQAGGSMLAVALQGSLAYVGVGPRLCILDVSQPSQPVMLGQTDPLPDTVENLLVSGGYAYVADTTAGLWVVDVRDPAHPVQVARDTSPKIAYSLALKGSRLFVGDAGGEDLWLYDISDPVQPRVVWSKHVGGAWVDLLVLGDVLYAAGGDLLIFDLSSPDVPAQVGVTPFQTGGGSALISLACAGQFLYAYTRKAELWVLDISSPPAPVKHGMLSLYRGTDQYENVAAGGGYVYLPYLNTLYQIDVSDPDHPQELRSLGLPSEPARLAIANDTAFVADMNSLRVLHLDGGASLTEIGAYEPGGLSGPLSRLGQVIYSPGLWIGMEGIDTSDPTHPVALGHRVDLPWARIFAYSDQVGYACGWTGDIAVLDISDPAFPQVLKILPAGSIQTLAFRGQTLLASDYSNGKLLVYDLADPLSPQALGELGLQGRPGDMVLSGTRAFVGFSNGVYEIDLSDPAHPALEQTLSLSSAPTALAIVGTNLVVGAGPFGYSLFDIHDFSQIVALGSFTTPGKVLDLAVLGPETVSWEALVVADDSAVLLIDLRDPAQPQIVASYPFLTSGLILPEGASHLLVQGNRVYVGGTGAGLTILKIDLPWRIYFPMNGG